MQLSIKCLDTNGKEHYVNVYLGDFKRENFPLFFQIKWLENQGLKPDQQLIESLKELKSKIEDTEINFLDAIVYLLET